MPLLGEQCWESQESCRVHVIKAELALLIMENKGRDPAPFATWSGCLCPISFLATSSSPGLSCWGVLIVPWGSETLNSRDHPLWACSHFARAAENEISRCLQATGGSLGCHACFLFFPRKVPVSLVSGSIKDLADHPCDKHDHKDTSFQTLGCADWGMRRPDLGCMRGMQGVPEI